MRPQSPGAGKLEGEPWPWCSTARPAPAAPSAAKASWHLQTNRSYLGELLGHAVQGCHRNSSLAGGAVGGRAGERAPRGHQNHNMVVCPSDCQLAVRDGGSTACRMKAVLSTTNVVLFQAGERARSGRPHDVRRANNYLAGSQPRSWSFTVTVVYPLSLTIKESMPGPFPAAETQNI